MSTALKLVLAIGLAAGAGMAAAQRTGSRVGQDSRVGDPEHARQAVDIVAGCIAVRRPQLADRWLRLLPGSTEEHALLDSEAEDMGLCMEDPQLVLDGRELLYNPASMRRAVAVELARRRAGEAPEARPLGADSEPWFMAAVRTLPAGVLFDRNSLLVQDFGHCVATSEWRGTRALLRSAAGSPEEAAAVRTLTPHLGSCLPEGSTIQLTLATLRAAVAEPFLHILAAPRATRPSGR